MLGGGCVDLIEHEVDALVLKERIAPIIAAGRFEGNSNDCEAGGPGAWIGLETGIEFRSRALTGRSRRRTMGAGELREQGEKVLAP